MYVIGGNSEPGTSISVVSTEISVKAAVSVVVSSITSGLELHEASKTAARISAVMRFDFIFNLFSS